MRKMKSLFFQTFIFSGILILVILMIAFSSLYLLLPRYYFANKEKTLQKNAELLLESLNQENSEEDVTEILARFSLLNNTDIVSLNKDGRYIQEFSTPYITMNAENREYVYINIEEFDDYGVSLRERNISVTGETHRVAEMEEDVAVARSYEETIDRYENEDYIYNEDSTTTIAWEVVSPYERGEQLETGENFAVRASPSFLADSYSPDILMTSIQVESPFINIVEIVSTLQPIDEASSIIFSLLPVVLAFSLGVGLLLAYVYSKKISDPVVYLSKVAVEMQDMNPHISSTMKSENELGVLSDNLNKLYTKLTGTIHILEEETIKTKALEKAKTQLMQSASHELKTPLAALNGITEGMIDEVGIYRNRDKYLLESKKQIDRLSNLVQEIIIASQAEGEVTLIPEEIHLPTLIESLLEEQKILMEEKQITLKKDWSDFIVITDYEFLQRSISNLLSNAVNYTDNGKTISILLEDKEDTVILQISNPSGEIPLAEMEKLLEPFYTGEYSRDREYHGTGLGLYIVSRNLRKLKLPFKVESTKEKFTAEIEFPKNSHH